MDPLQFMLSVGLTSLKAGVTIVAKSDYCEFAIVLTLQEVPLRYYYYCGLPLQHYCDTIV